MTPHPCDVNPAPGPALAASRASLRFEGGGLTVWAEPGVPSTGGTPAELRLVLGPGQAVVIGRQQGGEVEYLDRRYTPTPILPHSGGSVLTGLGDDRDRAVSRGHLLLRGDPAGVVLVNGVPSPQGDIRPPRNGTVLLEPEDRPLGPGEAYPIPHGRSAAVRLPNGTRVVIAAG